MRAHKRHTCARSTERRSHRPGAVDSVPQLNCARRVLACSRAGVALLTNCNECGKDRKVWGGGQLWHVGGMHLESVFRVGVLPMDDNKRLCFCGYVYQAKLPDIVIKAAKAKGSNG
jgi:hypothetical protein